MCPSYDSSILCPFLGIFPAGGGVKSDEDDHGSVCTVSGVLTLPGEEERKKEPFDSVDQSQFFPQKNSCAKEKKKKVI